MSPDHEAAPFAAPELLLVPDHLMLRDGPATGHAVHIADGRFADIGPADADVNPQSAELAWRNGTWVANGNLVWRHLGIPTVQVPMGMLDDIGMPIGLTFAGRGWDDNRLLVLGAAFEASANRPGSALGSTREPPPLTPEVVPRSEEQETADTVEAQHGRLKP